MRNTTNTRSIILKTALESFGSHGYFDTTTKEIAKKSNINETTLFYHFTDKAAIYQAVIDEYYHSSEAPLVGVNKKLKFENIEGDLYELAVTYSEMVMNNINILRIMLGRIPLAPEIKQESFYILPEISDHFRQYLTRAIEKNLIPSADYMFPCELFLSYISRLIIDLNVHDHINKLNKEVRSQLYPQLKRMCRFYADNFFHGEVTV